MSDVLETVVVDRNGVPVIVNKSDQGKQKLYVAPKKAKAKKVESDAK